MKKNLILAIMAVLAMTSCETKKNFESLSGEWNVVSIGELVVPDSVRAFLGFNLLEHIVYGSTGCNQLSGALPEVIDTKTPMFGAVGSTRMMCADMTVEDAMLPALGKVVDFKVNGDSLYLNDAEGAVQMSLVKRN